MLFQVWFPLVCFVVGLARAQNPWEFESFSAVFAAHSKRTASPVHEHAKLSARKDVVQLEQAASAARHEVTFACQQANLQELEHLVAEISNPASPSYGHHLTREEINLMTRNEVSSERILHFLEKNNVRVVRRSANDAYITADATIEQWEKILDTKFFKFTINGKDHSKTVTRSHKYSIPAYLRGHVSALFNVVDFPETRSRPQIIRKPFIKSDHAAHGLSEDGIPLCLGEEGFACPASVNYIYDMRNNAGNNLTTQAIFATIGQTMSPTDLTFFQQSMGLPIQAIAEDIGGHVADDACVPNDGDDCDEANLDIQYMMGMSQSVPTTFYYTNLNWVGWITQVADMADPPKVFSISYSSPESSISVSEASQFNTEAMKLAAMGVTLLAASGDDGAPGYGARDNGMGCGYAPQFPASCPYVTAVGGTQGPQAGDPEIACQSQEGGVITSGGGFSTFYPTPSWQAAEVTAYLNGVQGTDQQPAFGYNAAGRGYPDVAMLAVDYIVAANQEWIVLYGTSASSPVFAAMVAQVNAARLAAGKSTLGWINPSLYALAPSILLNDITSGNNKCTVQTEESVCCAQGFYARPGWDPVTGIGSVNFTALMETFMQLGEEPNVPTMEPTTDSTLTNPPVAAPTQSPTVVQTAMPTFGEGWLYVNTYTETECGGDAFVVLGLPTGTCLVDYEIDRTPTGSILYTCGAEYAQVNIFNSLDCDPATSIYTSTLYLGCTVESFGEGTKYSQAFLCAEGPSSAPYPLYGGDYAVVNYYSDEGCNGTLTEFAAYKNNFCVAGGTSEEPMSFNASFPVMQEYTNSSDCSNVPSNVTAFPTTCDVMSFDDDYDDGSVASPGWFEVAELYKAANPAPTAAPTAAATPAPSAAATAIPTAVPTVAPGAPTVMPSVNDLVLFSAAQVIDGIDLATYNSNVTAYSNALKLTIASCMQGVSTGNIINLVVTSATANVDVGAGGRVQLLVRRFVGALDTSGSAINAAYEVNVRDPALSYSTLSTELTSAVTSGAFTTNLHAYATTTGATGFATATSNSVATTDLQGSDDGDNDNNGGGLTAGEIVCIAFGVAAFVGLVAFFLYRYLFPAKVPMATSSTAEVDMSQVSRSV